MGDASKGISFILGFILPIDIYYIYYNYFCVAKLRWHKAFDVDTTSVLLLLGFGIDGLRVRMHIA